MLKRTITTTVTPAPQKRRGFTLMEMLVVVAIIVIIAGAATPLVLSYMHNARVDRAKMDMKNIETAVVKFESSYGHYPQSLQELAQPGQYGGTAPLDQKMLLDPWNNPYQYDPSNLTNRGVPRISCMPPGAQQPLTND